MLISKSLCIIFLIGLLHVRAGFFEDLVNVLGEVTIGGNAASASASASKEQPKQNSRQSRASPGSNSGDGSSDESDDDPQMNLNDMVEILGAANDGNVHDYFVAFGLTVPRSLHYEGALTEILRIYRPHSTDAKKPTQSHVPESNGCGAEGLFAKGRFDFTEICNNHDICYHTCLNKRPECDRMFEEEMMSFCKANVKGAENRKACESQASTFALFAEIGGCHTYLESQQDACDCVPTGKKPFRRHNDL